MPEGYTHVTIGTMALKSSRVKTGYLLAFGAGAQGPDPLFFVDILKGHKDPDWNAFGGTMHQEKTGAFLLNLLELAKTPVQKAYAMGFLTHYATDSLVHPYVAFMTIIPNAIYGYSGGHGFYEVALDSLIHQHEYGTPVVPAARSTPTPCIEQLREIAELFSGAANKTYGVELPEETVIRAFQEMRRLRGLLRSRLGVRRFLFGSAEKLLKMKPGFILSHLTPGAPMPPMPEQWENPFTHETRAGGVRELLEEAIVLGSEYLNLADDYWNGIVTKEEAAAKLGSVSYETGLPVD